MVSKEVAIRMCIFCPHLLILVYNFLTDLLLFVAARPHLSCWWRFWIAALSLVRFARLVSWDWLFSASAAPPAADPDDERWTLVTSPPYLVRIIMWWNLRERKQVAQTQPIGQELCKEHAVMTI